jgi:UDP-glucose 4,6-dehydratase
MKILLLGKSGYVGRSFQDELIKRGWEHFAVSRKEHDYTWLEELRPMVSSGQFHLVINCAAFIPSGSGLLCDSHQEETIKANVLFPAMLAQVCDQFSVPLAHISTGCLWSDGKEHNEADLPQRSFTGYCGFYIGTKWMSEQEVRQYHKHYIWRIRLPFDEIDSDRNYLSKLVRFPKVWDHNNTISHRKDFVKACLDMWQLGVPFGTYNVMNVGSIKAVTIVHRMMDMGIIKTMPEIVTGQPGDCQVSVNKLKDVGVTIRHVDEAINDSLNNWKPRV